MKAKDLHGLNVEELKDKLFAEKEAHKKTQFAHAISPIENPMVLREQRRNIARIETILAQKNNSAK
jgi:large subunit ribosomal protein L29